MKTLIGVVALLCAFVLIGYGCYHKGYSDADAKAARERAAEYGNDWNSDPSVKHSAAYSLGYARGYAAGEVGARQKDFLECGGKLAAH
jgi:hypothetical protein